MPTLEADFNPGIVDVLCRLAEQARELSGDIAIQAEKLRGEAELPGAGRMLVFAVPPLQAASPNLIREMFRVVWQREGWPMGDMDFERGIGWSKSCATVGRGAIFLEKSMSDASAAYCKYLLHNRYNPS